MYGLNPLIWETPGSGVFNTYTLPFYLNSDVVYDGTFYYSSGWKTTSIQGGAASWTQVSQTGLPSGWWDNPKRLSYLNGKFITCWYRGYNANTIYVSSNYITWTSVIMPLPPSRYCFTNII